ncbi:MAG: branched-chain amino acid ABC transporter substrate-binding protein [Solirubrobacteraceae bacterium]
MSRRLGLRRGCPALFATLVALAALATVTSCGETERSGATVSGSQLAVYSSLPLQGVPRQRAVDVLAAERLALDQTGSKVGDFEVRLVSLNDATAKTGRQDPGRILANARMAAQSNTTIAYIGELDPAASALSLPILNQARILQVSPGDTAVGLTRSEGSGQNEPGKYYPTDDRTFARVVPADHIQAQAVTTYMSDQGVKRSYVFNDRSLYGKALADQVAENAGDQGVTVAANEAIDPERLDARALGAKVVSSGADAVFYGGEMGSRVVELWRAIVAQAPQIKLFGPAALANEAFAKAIGPAGRSTFLTSSTFDPRLYPPAGQDFFKEFRDAYGRQPHPEAIYGFEAMSAVLEAVKAAGEQGNNRGAVIDAFFATKNRESVLGTYSIDENGDTTLTDYGAYRVAGGSLVFDKVLKAQT